MAKPSAINYDYFRLYEEIPLLFRASFARNRGIEKTSGKTLIVAASTIGDFIVTIPAIRTFLADNKITADIIVSPLVRPLAERIRGIDRVFVARSSSRRDIEKAEEKINEFDHYESIIILKISSDAYRLLKKIKSKKVKSHFPTYARYVLHLAKSSLLGKRPKQWRDIVFDMIDKKPRHMRFEDMFTFDNRDYERVRKLNEMKTSEKIILIHTGSNWPMLRWENAKWADLLNRINALGKFRIVFVGAEIESDDLREIVPLLNFKPHSLISKVDLRELLIAMRMSDYFIGVDSGPRNMANFADLRSIGLFGPGPHMFMPSDSRDVIIDKSKNRGVYERFFYKKNSLMNKITVDEVYDKFLVLTGLNRNK